MLAKIIFFSAVIAAVVVVILLAIFSPSPLSNQLKSQPLAISLYVQPQQPTDPAHHQERDLHSTRAFIFHHHLTEGPKNTSRIIGRARGLVLPVDHFALAAFNIIYLTFDMPQYRGSLGVEVRTGRHGAREELMVVGGTGSFAFARGVAVFERAAGQQPDLDGTYNIKLKLTLPG